MPLEHLGKVSGSTHPVASDKHALPHCVVVMLARRSRANEVLANVIHGIGENQGQPRWVLHHEECKAVERQPADDEPENLLIAFLPTVSQTDK